MYYASYYFIFSKPMNFYSLDAGVEYYRCQIKYSQLFSETLKFINYLWELNDIQHDNAFKSVQTGRGSIHTSWYAPSANLLISPSLGHSQLLIKWPHFSHVIQRTPFLKICHPKTHFILSDLNFSKFSRKDHKFI